MSLLAIKCKKIKHVLFSFPTSTEEFDMRRSIEIVEKYIESRDILECQEELITNGLKEYAKF